MIIVKMIYYFFYYVLYCFIFVHITFTTFLANTAFGRSVILIEMCTFDTHLKHRLSAGRSRSPAPNILPVDGGYGTRSSNRRTTYRPKSSPAYIISAVKDDMPGSPEQLALEQARYARMNAPTRLQPGGRVRPATTGGGMGGARSLRLHRQREPFAHADNRFGITEEESLTEPVPFVVHRRVRGWKLTSPYPRNNQLSRSSFVPANAQMNAMVRHKRLTAEDIMQEQHAQLAGDPSLLQPMMDPLAQVLEEEQKARVKLRQTAAVMETFERWQRGRATKPWRSGHAWDQPHPELPFEQSGDFRYMSSTPAAYAAMVRASAQDRAMENEETKHNLVAKLTPVL